MIIEVRPLCAIRAGTGTGLHGKTQRLKPICFCFFVFFFFLLLLFFFLGGGLPHTIVASVILQWHHCGDNRVSTGASSETERSLQSQAALKVIKLKTSHATNNVKANTTLTIPAPVNKNNTKHCIVKISYHIQNTAKDTSLLVQSMQVIAPCQLDKTVNILQMTFTFYFPWWISLYKSNWLLFITV